MRAMAGILSADRNVRWRGQARVSWYC